MTTSSVDERTLSLAMRRKVYVPAAEKLAVVWGTAALPKLTVPGPLTLVQVTDRVLPGGNPSSMAVPERIADEGSVMV